MLREAKVMGIRGLPTANQAGLFGVLGREYDYPIISILERMANTMRDETAAMQAATPDLNRLGHYERRAWSRLRRAVLRFIDIKFVRGKPLGSPAQA